MARLYAKRKGRSGSRRPQVKESPAWVQLKKDEIESLIVKLSGTGLTSAQIGQKLRDSYGVPDVHLATGKTVVKIMKEKGVKIDIPEDVTSLMKRAVQLQTHLKANPADLSNKRSLELVESRIRRLSRYYKREGVIPQDWDYTVTLAEIGAK
jgi:small subunit ribosomal protein S15